MNSDVTAAQAVELLAQKRIEPAQFHALHVLVRDRLRAEQRQAAFEAFIRNPQNSSLVEDLIRDLIERDAAFASAVEHAVAEARSLRRTAGRPSVSQSANASGRGRIYQANGDIDNSQDHSKRSLKIGGGLFAVVIVLVVLSNLVSTGPAELTANSTCAEFNQADSETQHRSVMKIADEMGVTGLGNPLVYPNVPDQCSYGAKTKTLGEVIAGMRN